MTILLKHSRIPGNTPNIVPGQLPINEADELIYVWHDGHKVAVDINKVRNYAAPIANGQDGAPLGHDANGPVWMPSLAPSSEVNGVVLVDAPPPAGIYGIPGAQLTGVGGNVSLSASRAVCEHFYVASDRIEIQTVMFNLISQSAGAIKLAIVDDFGSNLALATLSSPSLGINRPTLNAQLTTGHYRMIFWSAASKQLQQVDALAFGQGMTLDGSGNLLFLDYQYADVNYSTGIDVPNTTFHDSASATPGTRRFFTFNWTIPA